MHKLKSLVFIAGLALASLAAHAQGAQLTIAWDDNSTNEDGFLIERAPGLAATTGFVEINRVAANVKTYTDLNLPNKTAFSYRVAAFNADVPKSTYSNVASTTTPAAPLNGPTNNRIVGTLALLPNSKYVIHNGALAWLGSSGKINVRYGETFKMDPGQVLTIVAQ